MTATVVLLIVCIVGVSILIGAFGHSKYRNIVNPVTVFLMQDVGMYTILSSAVTIGLSSAVGIEAALLGALIYLAGFSLAFLLPQFAIFGRLASVLVEFIDSGRPFGFSLAKLAIMVLGCGVIFCLLIAFSSAGILWLLDPRTAYITGRAGMGPIFLMLQWGLMAMLVYVIWTRRPGLAMMVFYCALYSVAAQLTGSKANIIYGWSFAALYYHYYIRKIPTILIILAPFAAVGMVAGLLYLQGSYSNVLGAFAYFRDYAENTGVFLTRFSEFDYQLGYGALSDLWFYVPRAVVGSKPFEYGLTLIHAKLFPGAAAAGNTPGILPWALNYLDFGLIGVFVGGIVVGVARRAAYEAFLANMNSIFAFLLMVQIALGGIFAYATLPLMIVLGICLSIFYRKRYERPIG